MTIDITKLEFPRKMQEPYAGDRSIEERNSKKDWSLSSRGDEVG